MPAASIPIRLCQNEVLPTAATLGGRIAEARDDPVDGPHGQIEQRFGGEGGAAVRCRLERVGELLFGLDDGAT